MSVARTLAMTAILAALILATIRELPRTTATGPVGIVVTSAAPNGGSCPDAVNCTLRAAINQANADASGDPVVISFAPATFPQATPATIAITGALLPPISRANVTIDGAHAGVHIAWGGQDLSSTPDGLILMADGAAIDGISISGFRGACIAARAANATIGGDSSAGRANTIGSCGTGILVTGANATVAGNRIGFALDNQPLPVTTGIAVTAGNAVIGDNAGGGMANVIGNATSGIRVGGAGAAPFSGVTIAGNVIGRDAASQPAPVGTGIELRQPGSGTAVSGNTVAYAITGITAAADAGGVSVTGNRFLQNTFQGLSGMAIDLNADGIVNPNHAGSSGGANHLLNHPAFSRAVQSRISGSAADCPGCQVQLYLADHRPGSPNDYGRVLVAGGITTTDASGGFAFDNPAVTPGQWVTALVTDAQGNTSEFGPSTRVGAGVAQCGNVQLEPGWNHGGYFGVEPVVLGQAFPADGPGAGQVSAIYHYDSTSGQYMHWFAGSTAGRTLLTLEPGEAYWFLANGAATLGTGFSLSVPLPVSLTPGWNEVVYIGASADVRDALAPIAGRYHDIYHWTNDGESSGWQVFGDGSQPGWASDFTDLQACAAYEILVSEAVTLTPLQP